MTLTFTGIPPPVACDQKKTNLFHLKWTCFCFSSEHTLTFFYYFDQCCTMRNKAKWLILFNIVKFSIWLGKITHYCLEVRFFLLPNKLYLHLVKHKHCNTFKNRTKKKHSLKSLKIYVTAWTRHINLIHIWIELYSLYFSRLCYQMSDCQQPVRVLKP